MKKKKSKKHNITQEARLASAKRWLQNLVKIDDLCNAYAKRYKIDKAVAFLELCQLGYKEELIIQGYDKEGIEYEFMYDPYVDEMKAVPKGTEEWELPEFI